MGSNLAEVIEAAEERFTRIAPAGMLYDAEKGFAIQHLKANNYLMTAAQEHPDSLQGAICNVAAIGLSLNPAEKLCYLIPRNVKEGNSYITKVFLEPSYMGLVRLATNSGSIEWCQADIVHENDHYKVVGVDEKPIHERDPFSKDRGEIIGAYCTARTKTGAYLTTTMTIDEINGIMERSESIKQAKRKNKKPSGPWVTDFKEQTKKTVVRRAYKLWPRSDQSRMSEAVDMSNVNQGFDPIQTNPETKDYTAGQKEFYDQLIEADDALGLYVFSQTTTLGLVNNLYHSFKDGTKGKYQRLVDGLLKRGESQFMDYVELASEAKRNGDDTATEQLQGEVTEDIWKLIGERI